MSDSLQRASDEMAVERACRRVIEDSGWPVDPSKWSRVTITCGDLAEIVRIALAASPSPKAEASDWELALNAERILADDGHRSTKIASLAGLFLAVRREATSAGWVAALRNPSDDFIIAVGCNPDNGQFPQSDGRYWRVVFAKIADHLAANKPQDITPAHDPVSLKDKEQ